MLDRKIDHRNELGKLLLKKEVVEPQILERALRSLNGNGKFSQSLAQVLVNDFKFEHDKIYSELAELYAFKKLEKEESEESSPQISRIVKFMECYDTDFRKQLIKHKIIPFCFDDEIENKLVFGAVDPTDPELPKVVNKLNLNSYEIAYLPPQHYKKIL
ncbi:MAG: type II/IV secretion system protein, partial [Melioribacteraceae bacterium]|nr:type II/IV secretion system protein [Melioribacteraceae bacterium]